MMDGVYLVLLLGIGVPAVLGYGTGAPASACEDLTPGHTESPQSDASPYSIEIVGGATTFTKGTPVKVKITGQQYGGFLLQLRKKGETTPLGTWSAPPTGTKLLTCTTADSAMTHSSPDAKETSLEFTWNPPTSANGEYEFVATVAQTKATYWLGHKSDTLTANYQDTDTDTDTDKDDNKSTEDGDDKSGSCRIFQGASAFFLIWVTVMTSVFA